ncbi:hypothetical protein TWF102_008659 [Orbilia oligospora]|uniref:Uncharacterized protein n=1 Tax=Orbilia oligospora TaxID=2813651 RepID=A0A7C8J5Z0_ORBOL|nr:hypothetical protein TWF102_008659 [Orbilia oligospora]
MNLKSGAVQQWILESTNLWWTPKSWGGKSAHCVFWFRCSSAAKVPNYSSSD